MNTYDTTCNAPILYIPRFSQINRDAYVGYIYDSYIWTAVEADLAIICACMPSLAPVLAKFVPGFQASTAPRDQQHSSRCSIIKGPTNGPFSGSMPAFPLAHISTTVSPTAIVSHSSGKTWYHPWYRNGGVSGITAQNESEENIITSSADTTDIATIHDARGITKTTVIEQSFSVDSRTSSPNPTDLPTHTSL